MPLTPLLAVAAVAAGLHSWQSGRTLIARLDDPVFPELFLARAQRRTFVALVAGMLVAAVGRVHALWAIPLLIVAILVGDYQFRRELYAERWSVTEYLRYSLLAFIGTLGFWLLLALTPPLILAIASGWAPEAPARLAMILALPLAILLLGWAREFPRVWLALHRASPLQRADLEPRFSAIIARSKLRRPPPTFRYGATGAWNMNAMALPSTRQSCVAMGDTLLELLAPDEISAIFAHEVAHIEHFASGRVLTQWVALSLLVLMGVALPFVLISTYPLHASALAWGWPMVVAIALVVRISRSQAHETDSDRRAAALVGDPEPLIRALTRLHHFARLPRRWPYDMERAASHPSLARRIQALRAESPSGPAAIDRPVVLRSTTPGTFVVLEPARLCRFEGVPADATGDSLPTVATLREQAGNFEATAYGDLVELRVAVARGSPTLCVRDHAGKRSSLPLHPDDIPAAQRALDLLDGRLSRIPAERWPQRARLAAIALAVLGMMAIGWAWVPLLITLIAPSVASLAALGAMGVGRFAFAIAVGETSPASWVGAAIALPAAVGACWLARRWSGASEHRGSAKVVGLALGAAGALLVLALVTVGAPAPSAVVAEPAFAALGLVALGGAAALLTVRDRSRRMGAAALALLSLTILGLVAMDARHAATEATIAWVEGSADRIGGFEMSSAAQRVRLSPDGRIAIVQAMEPTRYDVSADHDDDVTGSWRFTLGTAAGVIDTIDAFDLAVVDDRRLLVLRPIGADTRDSLELTIRALDGDTGRQWRRTLPPLVAPTVTVDRDATTWSVIGYEVDRAGPYRGVILTGDIGGARMTTTPLPRPLGPVRPLLTRGDGTFIYPAFRTATGTPVAVLRALGMIGLHWDLWEDDGGDRRLLATLPGYPTCDADATRVLCTVTEIDGVTAWRIDPAAERPLTSLGTLPRDLGVWRPTGPRTLAAASFAGTSLATIDLTTGHATRATTPTPPDSTTWVSDIAMSGPVIATLSQGDHRTAITFYRLR